MCGSYGTDVDLYLVKDYGEGEAQPSTTKANGSVLLVSVDNDEIGTNRRICTHVIVRVLVLALELGSLSGVQEPLKTTSAGWMLLRSCGEIRDRYPP